MRRPLLKKSGLEISTPLMKTFLVAVAAAPEDAVMVRQRLVAKDSIFVPKAKLRRKWIG